ncbi:hypothetical protein [Bacillus mycoides]|uniref:hypothetical protein n=1 Tax=Bacillus mycoides TaxID=1405 RepID=UPI003A80A218
MEEKSVVLVMDVDMFEIQKDTIYELRKTSIQTYDGSVLINTNLVDDNKKLKAENDALMVELAKCRDVLLPLLEGCGNYDNLLCESVADPMAVAEVCKVIAKVYGSKK